MATISTGASVAAISLIEELAPCCEADQADPFAGEDLLQRRGHHAAVPRSPVDADRAAAGAAARLGLGELVEHLVGNGVIDLTDAAEAAGDGGKEGEEAEVVFPGGVQERTEPVDLGAVDQGKLFPGSCR